MAGCINLTDVDYPTIMRTMIHCTWLKLIGMEVLTEEGAGELRIAEKDARWALGIMT